MSPDATRDADYERPDWWNNVPAPVQRKKRVYHTKRWEECPSCGRELGTYMTDQGVRYGTRYRQNLMDNPPCRTYEPCGCVVYGPRHSDGGDS